MDDNQKWVSPDEPAYSVPPTVDYTLLTNLDTPIEADIGDGSGFDDEAELPASDYPEVGDQNVESGNDSV